MAVIAIILLAVAASIVFGIVHDMATAHLCVEYFTIGHPKVIESEDPVMLALTWGVLATWWVGLIGGLVLAWAAREGDLPKWGAGRLVRPMATCLLVMGVCAAMAWLAGHYAAEQGWVELVKETRRHISPDQHIPFLANLWAHLTSYFVGGVGILLVAFHVRRGRRKDVSAPA